MEWVIFLNVVMLSRLGYLTRESDAPPRTAWLICALQVLSLVRTRLAIPGAGLRDR